jgi:hypothetical protein
MPFSLHLQSTEEPAQARVLSRTIACAQFLVVFVGAFVIFDAAVTGGAITQAVAAEIFIKAETARVIVAPALSR